MKTPLRLMNFMGGVFLGVVLVFVSIAIVFAQAPPEELLCGLAVGYPPYQFQDASGDGVGIDVEVLQKVVEKMQMQFKLQQGAWDDVVGQLRLGQLDCVGGMEINDLREKYFDFTFPYYSRKIVIFVLADNQDLHTIDDLQYQIIAGDRHSFVERYFREKGIKNKIRIRQTKSKDESMRLLKKGEVVAVVGPLAVGTYLAKQLQIKVRLLQDSDPGSPVGIAVKKGNAKLLEQLNSALQQLVNEGTLEDIFRRWGVL